MSNNLDANIDFFIKNGMNVLFVGRHGTGKTARILKAFQDHNLKFQYFSASTMDPWVDFIGIPKEKTENGKTFLDLVRPKAFQDDDVEAIFLDEYNRAPKKIRNAVMELIQFKSINGKKFNNLKIVWAAINPEEDGDDKYDVEALDPAQEDRFHAKIVVPFTPDLKYFKGKYDEMTATAAVTWWKELEEKQQRTVSPRRLDYALEVYTKGGDIKFVLTNDALNINKLITELRNGPISANLKKFFDLQDSASAKTFLQVENNYAAATEYIQKKKEYTNFFVPLLSDERIITLMAKDKLIEEFIFAQPGKFQPLIEDLSKNPASKLARRATQIIQEIERKKMVAQQLAAQMNNVAPAKTGQFEAMHSPHGQSVDFDNKFSSFVANGTKPNIDDTVSRINLYNDIRGILPKDLHKCNQPTVTLIFQTLVNIAVTSPEGKVKKDMPDLIRIMNHFIKEVPTVKTTIAPALHTFLVNRYPSLWI